MDIKAGDRIAEKRWLGGGYEPTVEVVKVSPKTVLLADGRRIYREMLGNKWVVWTPEFEAEARHHAAWRAATLQHRSLHPVWRGPLPSVEAFMADPGLRDRIVEMWARWDAEWQTLRAEAEARVDLAGPVD